MADPQGADPHRLPRTVVPSRYDLVLEPDLDAGTFRGTVAASVDVVDAVAELVLNAIELVIDEAWVVDANGTRSDASVSYDEATERATLSFDGALVTGTATVHASFRGILNDKLHGFYRSTFTDADGHHPHARHHPVRVHRRPPGLPVLGRARLQGRLRRDPRGARRPARASRTAPRSAARTPATAGCGCASPTPC